MDGWLGFIFASVALAGSPGPATLSIAAAAAAFGARRTLPYLLGIGVGMDAVMAIVATGVVGLVLALPAATPVVTVLAAGYFVYLAWQIATAPRLTEVDPKKSRAPRFVAGLLLSLVNPKGYVAMTALFSGFRLSASGAAEDAMIKILTLPVVIAAVNAAWLLAGAALTRAFRHERLSRAINVAFAILLIVSTIFAMLL